MVNYNGEKPNWDLIPSYMVGGMRRYFEQGMKPGSFLCAVLQNDFMEIVAHADGNNLQRLREYAVFLHMYAPRESFGSKKNFDKWVEKGGLGLKEIYNG